MADSTLRERATASLLVLIRELVLPRLTYLGLYRYVVAEQPDGPSMANVEPEDPKLGLPPISKCRVVPSVLGEAVMFTPGSIVVVAFMNGDPTKPRIVMGDPDTPPLSSKIVATAGVQLGASGALPIARATDPVQAGPFSGVIVNGSPLNTAG